MKIDKFEVTKFLDDLKASFDEKIAERISGDIAQTVSMMFDHSVVEALNKYIKKLENKENKK